MSLPSVTPTDVNERRETFFRILFGNARGYLCIATITESNTVKKKFDEEFFTYPDELPLVLKRIESQHGANVYFCPQLFSQRTRKKQFVDATPNVWADLDFCEPLNMLIEPTIVLESSPGRYQAFWALETEHDPDDVEDIARRIAYKHAHEGADKSGWDLTQLLRVPYTLNYKYPDPPIVKPIYAKKLRYTLTDFDAQYPLVTEYYRITTPKPPPTQRLNSLELLEEVGSKMNPTIWGLYNDPPDENEWSEKLWKLMLLLFENGFNAENVYYISRTAACNKYERDGRPDWQLWKDVCRAEIRYENQSRIAFGKSGDHEQKQIDLMTASEREQVKADGDTFIERYIHWASSLGDAAVQYHQAGAFVALSSVLCGRVRLPTSYGVIIPNLWFMILADTTLTRKSTAMDICVDLLEEIDEDVVMATDGSIEGLMTHLAGRSDRASIFLRDEFSGLVEQMTKKDYMSGMPELFTKLYDGKMQKRQLRRETIEVRSPRLIIFGGGIKDATAEAMTPEMISSGFIPRFIFITAESDISRVKPIGPPTNTSSNGREVIGAELMRIHQFYNQDLEQMVPETDTVVTMQKFYDVEMTPEAWDRYNKLEMQMTKYGVDSDRPNIYTPVGDRLAKSMLKAAVLIAAAKDLRQRVIVEEVDILRAISYGEKWFTHSRAIIESIGTGASERRLQEIAVFVARYGGAGVTRAEVMRTFKLDARNYTGIADTLEGRGMLIRTKAGKLETLRSVAGFDFRTFG